MTTWMCGYHGYSPEHLCELSLEQRYDDGEADARRDQVEKSGLWAGRQTGGQRDRQAGGEQVIIQQETSYYPHFILKPDCLQMLLTTLFINIVH